ncbi:MAG TPA: hypothetical protein VGP24_09195, partial [Glaciihabitans sp.]|nr:hypothetical protein [Glaciihabitans sp.]
IFTTYKVSAAATLDDLRGYDIVAVDSQGLVPAKVALLKDAYAAGMSILTVSQVGDQTWLPFVTASAAKADDAIKYRMDPPTYDHRLKGGWDNGADDLSSTAGKVITGIDPLSAVGVSVFQYNAVQTYTHVIGSNLQGGRWFHHNNTIIKTASNRILWAKAVSWLHNFKSDRNWEIQLGEFCIDTIAEDNFPPHVKITARDYTKLCIESKLSKATTFSKGQRVEDMIRAVAANCGISRMIVPRMSATLEADVTFDRETERWKIISDLAATVAHEAFFDNMGFLVVRPIADPSLTPITWTFGVGVQNVDEKVTVEILGTNYVHDGGMRSSAPGFGVDGVAGMGFALGDAAIVRRNFVPNPIAAVDLAGYTTWGAGVTHTRMTTGGHLTPECVQVVTPGTAAAEGEGYGVGPVAPNTRSQFAGAVFLKGAVGGEKVNIWARYNYVDGSATSDSVAKNVTLTTGWQRFVANSIPPNAGKEISTVTLFLRTPTILAQTFYVWGTDVAATTDVTQMNSYVDGNQTGCRWVGEPGTSISEQYVRHLSPGKVGVVSLRQDAVSEISTVVRGASYITPVVA